MSPSRMPNEELTALREKYQGMKLFPGPALEARDTVLRLLDELDRTHIAEPLRGVAVRASAPRIAPAAPPVDEVWGDLAELRKLVEADDPEEVDSDMRMALRLLEVSENAGGAAGAWVGFVIDDGRDREVTAERLADTAITALIALATLRTDAARHFARRVKDLVRALSQVEEGSEQETAPESGE